MRHNGKRYLKDQKDFEAWAVEIVADWVLDMLGEKETGENVAVALQQPPASYPAVVVWKGTSEFDCWYVTKEDFK